MPIKMPLISHSTCRGLLQRFLARLVLSRSSNSRQSLSIPSRVDKSASAMMLQEGHSQRQSASVAHEAQDCSLKGWDSLKLAQGLG